MNYPLNVRIRGEGAPLLFVNGLFHNSALWDLVTEEVSSRCKVITFDFPNQSRAGTFIECVRIEAQAQCLQDALSEAGVTAAETTVFALSHGANITRYLHSVLGVDFRQLILVGSNPGLGNFFRLHNNALLQTLDRHGLEAFSWQSLQPVLSAMYFDRYPLIKNLVIKQQKTLFGDRVDALKALLTSVLHDSTLDHPPVKFRSPTLFLHGSDDAMCPARAVKAYTKQCSGPVTYAEVGGGHAFPMEDPAATGALISELLDGAARFPVAVETCADSQEAAG